MMGYSREFRFHSMALGSHGGMGVEVQGVGSDAIWLVGGRQALEGPGEPEARWEGVTVIG